ncbi:MAG: zeta toxin family protein [Bacteroidales bacterium]|nr:zeta toxin family protein [Bacteroidales bacterium]
MNKHKPILIVIAGPNGSGKTTITSKILKHEWLEDAVYVNPDMIAQEKFGDWNSPDVYVYDNSVENEDATLLFRFSEGTLIKKYTTEVPQWAIPFL